MAYWPIFAIVSVALYTLAGVLGLVWQVVSNGGI